MKAVVAFPSTGIFGQQVALSFHERGALEALFTTFAFKPGGLAGRTLAALPGAQAGKLLAELQRRGISALPENMVETRPFWELARTAADKLGMDRQQVDKIWERLSFDYTRAAGRRLRKGGDAIYAYEFTALEAFAAATRVGAAKILDFPSLNSRQFQELQREQKAAYPELADQNDAYFETVFERRQARRDAEMNAADIIITNSSVTRASHIAWGADPDHTFAVNCGAPVPLAQVPPKAAGSRPLRVIWAGTFSIRKGAHLLVEAWRTLGAGPDAVLDVYGSVTVPERIWKPAPAGMTFHGSVVRDTLFAAFDAADVLMFPTLSDGFGMVVTEAFSRGLPVITTDQAGASDLVRNGENGLVIPAGDPVAIAQSLRWCLDNRDQLAPMAQAALETARGWQWSDYRARLYETITGELARQGRLA
jgi:glycosyltransferase involved in cell wall biosynthesis